MLLVKYLAFILVGLSTFWVGVPKLRVLTEWDARLPAWGLLVTISAAVCAYGVRSGRETVEKWAGIVLVAMLGVYLFGVLLFEPDWPEKAVWAAIVITLSMSPAARIGYLMTRSGVSHTEVPYEIVMPGDER